MIDIRNVYGSSVGRPEGKRLLRRPGCWWEDNIRMHLKYVGRVWTGYVKLRIGTSGGVL
jgi:hypothetical protein